jgi:hypothetical protein
MVRQILVSIILKNGFPFNKLIGFPPGIFTIIPLIIPYIQIINELSAIGFQRSAKTKLFKLLVLLKTDRQLLNAILPGLVISCLLG